MVGMQPRSHVDNPESRYAGMKPLSEDVESTESLPTINHSSKNEIVGMQPPSRVDKLESRDQWHASRPDFGLGMMTVSFRRGGGQLLELRSRRLGRWLERGGMNGDDDLDLWSTVMSELWPVGH
ncbi:hypothetical protein FCV25MIE_25629 [Fagus crenata]